MLQVNLTASSVAVGITDVPGLEVGTFTMPVGVMLVSGKAPIVDGTSMVETVQKRIVVLVVAIGDPVLDYSQAVFRFQVQSTVLVLATAVQQKRVVFRMILFLERTGCTIASLP